MRKLLAVSLITLLLAGCTAPGAPVNPLVGSCPQWVDGVSTSHNLAAPGDVVIDAATQMVGASRELALDRYHVVISEVVGSGVIELRAIAESDDRSLRFTDYRNPAGPTTPTFIALDANSGTIEVDVYLSELTHDATAMPTALRLVATSADGSGGRLHLEVTPGYRVCGAPV